MYTKMLEVKTKEDLRVKIYGGRILCVAVDCIVNASNEYLMHGGGVAAAISEAAGYEFDRESREFVKKKWSYFSRNLLCNLCRQITLQVCDTHSWSQVE